MDTNINVCTLITAALWAAGITGFAAISLDLLHLRHAGLAVASFTMGSFLHLRRLIRTMRRREDAAFELGRMSAGGDNGGSHLHRVL